MKNHILIIGAFDRYNYGDLLFPLIIEQQLQTYEQSFIASYYGIVESDLSSVGGKPTQDISSFYQRCSKREGHTSVIVAGGEAVGVTWSSLLLSLNPLYKKTHRFHQRINHIIDLNAIAKWWLHGKTDLPFVFTSSDFVGVDHVVFNSLGGSELQPSIFQQYPHLVSKLRQIDYFAVRDNASQQVLAKVEVPVHLYPDSAILMSKFFPVTELERRVSNAVREFVGQHQGRYVFFQIKNNHAKQHEQILAAQLDAVARHSGLHLCLCPIGKALNHDDHLALGRIAPLLNARYTLFNHVTIWDIMFLIAQSGTYIGTSLHGAITAMSYAVPYVGLAVPKLDSYLNTWGVAPLNHTWPIDAVYSGFLHTLETDRDALEESRARQLAAAEESFSTIRQLVLC